MAPQLSFSYQIRTPIHKPPKKHVDLPTGNSICSTVLTSQFCNSSYNRNSIDQQAFVKPLLCVRYSTRHWEYPRKKKSSLHFTGRNVSMWTCVYVCKNLQNKHTTKGWVAFPRVLGTKRGYITTSQQMFKIKSCEISPVPRVQDSLLSSGKALCFLMTSLPGNLTKCLLLFLKRGDVSHKRHQMPPWVGGHHTIRLRATWGAAFRPLITSH